jgi:hypothetical protein
MIVCLLTGFLVGVMKKMVASMIVQLTVYLAVFSVDFEGVDGLDGVVWVVAVCMEEWVVIGCTSAC